MQERSQFTFYASYYEALAIIKKATDRAAAYDAIARYALYGEQPDLGSLPDTVAIAFKLVCPTLEASRRKSENGKRGGRPKGGDAEKQTESRPKADRKQTESNPKADRKQTESKKEREKEKENEVENEVENEEKREEENECYSSCSLSPTSPPFPSSSLPSAGDEAKKIDSVRSRERFDDLVKTVLAFRRRGYPLDNILGMAHKEGFSRAAILAEANRREKEAGA